MNFKALSIAAAALFATAAHAGGALTFVDGSAGFSNSFAASSSAITDTWTFSLASTSDANASAVSIKLGKKDWDFKAITLSGNGNSYSFAPTVGSTDAFETWSLDTVRLGAGSYTLKVEGFVSAPATSGSYGGNINVSAVPEPETYALMLAGLGAVGFIARRRRAA